MVCFLKTLKCASQILAAMFMCMAFVGCARQKSTIEPPRLLVFSKTAGFRHDSIPAGQQAIQKFAVDGTYNVTIVEDAAAISRNNLPRYKAVVFLNTSGDVLDEAQESALKEYILGGGGFVGVHAAADTEHHWPWYGELVGARFKSHPHVQPAEIIVHDRRHRSTNHLSQRWRRTDEWYNFDQHPRQRIGAAFTLLASIDESTYIGGDMNADHPFSWCHQIGKGRAWYTAGGHTIKSYTEPDFVQHLRGGILWAMNLE
jgi:type 1 glutamine amidotransferase